MQPFGPANAVPIGMAVNATWLVGRTPPQRASFVQQALLACGVLAGLAYVGGDVSGALEWPEYHSSSQTVAVLVASDAPSRPLVVRWYVAYEVLLTLFGVGVWRTRMARQRMYVVASLIFIVVIVGALSYIAFPERIPTIGTQPLESAANLLEATLGILIMFAYVLSAFALGTAFRYVAMTCLAVFVALSAAAGIEARELAHAHTTPGLGIIQRICILTFFVWLSALAIELVRANSSAEAAPDDAN
jgi:hypothetical protein